MVVVSKSKKPPVIRDRDKAKASIQLEVDHEVDLDELLKRIVGDITSAIDADRGTLYLVDHARKQVVSRVAHLPELDEIRLQIGEGVAGWVAQTGALVNVPYGTTDPRFTARIDRETGYRTRSLLAVPVISGDGSVIGVIQVLNKRIGDFVEGDEAQLTALASRVAEQLGQTSLAAQLRPGNERALSFRFNNIVGDSPPMLAVFDRTARAAQSNATVLIRGQSGSGKEAIARAVHYNSPRRDQPFVKVDCAALPEQLIENELFGHERGAYTSADSASEGQVAAADGGTLFLDEVGELPLHVQGKLLRLIQERAFVRVGGTAIIRVNLRFVCATNRDLEAAVNAGTFRQDLYYRLRVVEIVVPPLHSRGHADIDRLADYFLCRYSARHERPGLALSAAARAALRAHRWPGNVRELENCVESAVVLAPGATIEPEHLSLRSLKRVAGAGPDALFTSRLRPLRDVERDYLRYALQLVGGNRSAAARALGIGRNTLNRKLKDPPG